MCLFAFFEDHSLSAHCLPSLLSSIAITRAFLHLAAGPREQVLGMLGVFGFTVSG